MGVKRSMKGKYVGRYVGIRYGKQRDREDKSGIDGDNFSQITCLIMPPLSYSCDAHV